MLARTVSNSSVVGTALRNFTFSAVVNPLVCIFRVTTHPQVSSISVLSMPPCIVFTHPWKFFSGCHRLTI